MPKNNQPKLLKCPHCGATQSIKGIPFRDNKDGRVALRRHIGQCSKNPESRYYKKKSEPAKELTDKWSSAMRESFFNSDKDKKETKGGQNMADNRQDQPQSVGAELSRKIDELLKSINEYIVKPQIEKAKREKENAEKAKIQEIVKSTVKEEITPIEKKIEEATKVKKETEPVKANHVNKVEHEEPLIKRVHGASISEMLSCDKCEPILTPQVAEAMIKNPEWRDKVLNMVCKDDMCRVEIMKKAKKIVEEKEKEKEEKTKEEKVEEKKQTPEGKQVEGKEEEKKEEPKSLI